LFNKGISRIYLGDVEEGLLDMEHAQAYKAKEEHDVIDDAIAARGEDYTVFCIVSRRSSVHNIMIAHDICI